MSSILSGLLSFMLENTATLGSVDSSDAVRMVLAKNSMAENLKNPQFRKLFPDVVARYQKDRARESGGARNGSAAQSEGLRRT